MEYSDTRYALPSADCHARLMACDRRQVILTFMRGIINIVIGAVFIIGGLTGNLVLIGTHSGIALAGVGAALVALGLYRMTHPA